MTGRRHILFWPAILTIAILAGSCSWGKIPTRNYYMITYHPVADPPVESQRPYPYSIQVGRFEVTRIFNRQNIVYRFSPHQIQYYELERWGVRPEYMFTNLVSKHLETVGLTNRVGTEFFDSRPDFRIEGRVEGLEKYDAGDLFYAHMSMSFKLVRVRDGAQVWEYSFDERRQVYNPEMVYTVQALSGIFQSEMSAVTTQLDSLFLAMSTGKHMDLGQEEPVVAPSQEKSGTDGEKLDESGFEIIRERR